MGANHVLAQVGNLPKVQKKMANSNDDFGLEESELHSTVLSEEKVQIAGNKRDLTHRPELSFSIENGPELALLHSFGPEFGQSCGDFTENVEKGANCVMGDCVTHKLPEKKVTSGWGATPDFTTPNWGILCPKEAGMAENGLGAEFVQSSLGEEKKASSGPKVDREPPIVDFGGETIAKSAREFAPELNCDSQGKKRLPVVKSDILATLEEEKKTSRGESSPRIGPGGHIFCLGEGENGRESQFCGILSHADLGNTPIGQKMGVSPPKQREETLENDILPTEKWENVPRSEVLDISSVGRRENAPKSEVLCILAHSERVNSPFWGSFGQNLLEGGLEMRKGDKFARKFEEECTVLMELSLKTPKSPKLDNLVDPPEKKFKFRRFAYGGFGQGWA